MRWAVAVAAVASVLLPAGVRAERSRRFRYRADDVWRAAVRLVRVDYGFPIREKDREGGYVLFDYVEGRRKVPGAVEVVEIERDGERTVLVRVLVQAMPSYVERMMMDRLVRKLRDELGPEPRRPAAPPRPADRRDEPSDDEEGEARD